MGGQAVGAVGRRARVADNPVEALGRVGAPSDNRDDVVGHQREALGNPARVRQDLGRVDAARDRAAVEDLLLHGGGTGDGAVLSDGSVGVRRQAGAVLAEGGAGAGDVERRAAAGGGGTVNGVAASLP